MDSTQSCFRPSDVYTSTRGVGSFSHARVATCATILETDMVVDTAQSEQPANLSFVVLLAREHYDANNGTS